MFEGYYDNFRSLTTTPRSQAIKFSRGHRCVRSTFHSANKFLHYCPLITLRFFPHFLANQTCPPPLRRSLLLASASATASPSPLASSSSSRRSCSPPMPASESKLAAALALTTADQERIASPPPSIRRSQQRWWLWRAQMARQQSRIRRWYWARAGGCRGPTTARAPSACRSTVPTRPSGLFRSATTASTPIASTSGFG